MKRRKPYDPHNRSDDARIRSALATYIRQGGAGNSKADVVTFRRLRYVRIFMEGKLAAVFRVLSNGALRRMKRPPTALKWRDPELGPPIGASKVIGALQVIKHLAAHAGVPEHIVASLALARVKVDDGKFIVNFPRSMQACADEATRYRDNLSAAIGTPLIVAARNDGGEALHQDKQGRPSPTPLETASIQPRRGYEAVQIGQDEFNVRGLDGKFLFNVALTLDAARTLAKRLNERHATSAGRGPKVAAPL